MNLFWISVFFIPIHFAFAAHHTPDDLQKVQVPTVLRKKLKSFEPSSAVYLQDLGLYLVSSDDTDKKETPYLFLMDSEGHIDSKPLRVQGLKAMTDIESLSEDEQGHLYLLSSLSINKNGKNKISRNLFVEVHRRGASLVAQRHVELRSLLIAALQTSEFKDVAPNLEKEIDIESHFIRRGELYIGLKNPQAHRHQAMVLNLGSVEVLLREKRIEGLSLWRMIDFSILGSEALLSDMQLRGNDLYLTTTSDKGTPGALWHLDVVTETLTLMDSFAGVKPEGLALKPDNEGLLVVFDQGEDSPLFYEGPFKL